MAGNQSVGYKTILPPPADSAFGFAIDTVGAQLLGIVPEDQELPYRLGAGMVLPQQSGARAACRNIALRLLGQTVELGV